MRIQTSQRVGGVPITEVRAFVRMAVRWDEFTASGVAEYLDRPLNAVRRLVRALATEGYLERAPGGARPLLPGNGGRVWQVSAKGRSLAHATAAPPIRRATADTLLAGVVERAHTLRDWSAHPYALGVRRLIVFGSYLGDAPTLGDLDVSVSWAPRFVDREAQYTYRRARIALAARAGRSFSNLSSEVLWPDIEVGRFLRGGARGVSLHAYDEEPDFIAGVPHRVLIDGDPPPAPAPLPPTRDA